jgi:hypothetical protein
MDFDKDSLECDTIHLDETHFSALGTKESELRKFVIGTSECEERDYKIVALSEIGSWRTRWWLLHQAGWQVDAEAKET